MTTGRLGPEPLGDETAERDVAPSEVRSEVHETVGPADNPGDRDAEAGDPASRWDRRLRGPDELADVFDRLIGGEAPRLMRDPDEVQDATAQPDHGGGQRVDGDLGGDDGGTLGVGAGHQRRTTRRAETGRIALLDQATGAQVGDQLADRAPGHPQGAADLGSRQRPRLVQEAEQEAQVVAADGFGRGHGTHASMARRACDRLDGAFVGVRPGSAPPRRERTSMVPAASRTSATTMSIHSDVTPIS